MASNRADLNLYIKPEWCKGCNICVEFRPKQISGLDKNQKIEILDIDNCIKCGQCQLRCPDFAIFLGGKGDE